MGSVEAAPEATQIQTRSKKMSQDNKSQTPPPPTKPMPMESTYRKHCEKIPKSDRSAELKK